MRNATLALGLALVACGSPPATAATEPAAVEASTRDGAGQVADEGSMPERRCLPVVAADCGCVYSCGVGTLDADGWSVVHPRWGDTPVRARVDRWCVEGECTDAFLGEIVCGGICAPRAADPSCTFDAQGQCG